ncbi:hypothetical protein [Pontimicrobium sp. MEBiC06410]
MKTVAKEKNHVYADYVNVKKDLENLKKGNYQQKGNVKELENGRTYTLSGRDGMELVPLGGPGVFPASRGGFKGLGVLNEKGLTKEAYKIMTNMKLDKKSIREAYSLYFKVHTK